MGKAVARQHLAQAPYYLRIAPEISEPQGFSVLLRGPDFHLQPDLTVLMDNDVGASLARARRRNLAARDNAAEVPDENRFEQENRMFFTRVRDAFLKIARREPGRVLVVDARRTPDVVHAEIVREVGARLQMKMGTAQ